MGSGVCVSRRGCDALEVFDVGLAFNGKVFRIAISPESEWCFEGLFRGFFRFFFSRGKGSKVLGCILSWLFCCFNCMRQIHVHAYTHAHTHARTYVHTHGHSRPYVQTQSRIHTQTNKQGRALARPVQPTASLESWKCGSGQTTHFPELMGCTLLQVSWHRIAIRAVGRQAMLFVIAGSVSVLWCGGERNGRRVLFSCIGVDLKVDAGGEWILITVGIKV